MKTSFAFQYLFLARFFLLICIIASAANAQINQNFDFSLGLDYSAAEKTLDFFERRTFNVKQIAYLRGNQLAIATSVLLARSEKTDDDFFRQLELARDLPRFESDVYGFSPGRNRIPELRTLIQEMRRRQIDRRIVATISSFFPEQAKIATRFPVYFVVIGNERAAAFVRNVAWNYDVPTFVGEGRGEPVIVVNLARVIQYTDKLENQFIEVLSVTAHECFHAALSILHQSLPDAARPKNAAEQLLDLTQNEGVAYYLSMQTHAGGETPSPTWFHTTTKAIEKLNQAMIELHSPRLTNARVRQLLMDANLSGSFEENYGSTAGLRMAYEIEAKLGRSALTETLLGGGRSFLSVYKQTCLRDGALPKFDKRLFELMRIE